MTRPQPTANTQTGADTPSSPEEAAEALFDRLREIRNGDAKSGDAVAAVVAAFRGRDRAIRAEEREKVAEFMLERSLATGHGDTIEDLLRELYAGARLAQRKRDEDIALRYKLESYIAEQIANAIHNENIGKSGERTSAPEGGIAT